MIRYYRLYGKAWIEVDMEAQEEENIMEQLICENLEKRISYSYA